MQKPKLPKRSTVKFVAKAVAATSVKMVIATAIAQTVPVESKQDKAKLFVGTYVIGGMVAEAGKTHIGNQVDSAYDTVETIKKMIADSKETPETN